MNVSRLIGSALLVVSLWPLAGGAKDGEPIRIEKDGLKLEMAALGSDQVRAFFLARGFSPEDAWHIAETACLFRSAIGSSFTALGEPEVTVTLGQWRVTPAGDKATAPKVREDWEAVWKARGAPEHAATAYYWSLFPSEQTFFPTDYNWGFLTFGLPPGTGFDLSLVWRTGDATHTATVEGLQCAR